MLIALIACSGPVVFQDDIDPKLDIDLFSRETTDLHSPYVQTAVFDLSLVGARGQDISDWSFESSDPEVLALSEFTLVEDGVAARASALGDGEVELQAFDGRGDLRHTELVAVRAPTDIELKHVAPLLLEDEELLDEDAPVLLDGTATMLIQYHHEDELLHGWASGLEIVSADELLAEPLQQDFREKVDLVQVTPLQPGEHRLEVALGEVTETRIVEVVGREDLVGLQLERSDEEDENGNEIVVAFGEDAEGRHVLGLEPAWTVNGAEIDGTGDVFAYQQEVDALSDGVAHFDGLEAPFTFQGTDGIVETTNDPGCSATGLGASALLALAGLLVARRRS